MSQKNRTILWLMQSLGLLQRSREALKSDWDMEGLEKLERLSLVSKVCSELENHLGINDKTLAEFILSLHDNADGDFKLFRKQLDENGASELDEGFLLNLDRIIFQMKPKKKLGSFTSLSLPNQQPAVKQEHVSVWENGDGEKLQHSLDKKMFHHFNFHSPSRNESGGIKVEPSSPTRHHNEHKNDRRDDLFDRRDGRVGRNRSDRDDDRRDYGRGDRRDEQRGYSRDDQRGDGGDEPRGYSRDEQRGDRYNDRRNENDSNNRDSMRENRRGREHEEESVETRQKLDAEPQIFKIYPGRVTNVKEFGAFVQLEGIEGKREGLVHVSAIMAGVRIAHPQDVVSRSQKVKVKVLSVAGTRISLSMKDVDQETGRDLAPMDFQDANDVNPDKSNQNSFASSNPERPPVAVGAVNGAPSDVMKRLNDDSEFARKQKKRLTSPELWEMKQLIASGVMDPSQYPNLDDNFGVLYEAETEVEIDIELREDEPIFLKGQTSKTLNLSPIKVVKVPDGSLHRAAMAGASLARDRKEIRQQRENDVMDAASKDLTQAWVDPMTNPEGRQFAQDVRATKRATLQVPEWKRETVGKATTFGRRTNMSIREQRESLPIFKLREPLIRAIYDNQILVVIGDTGSGAAFIYSPLLILPSFYFFIFPPSIGFICSTSHFLLFIFISPSCSNLTQFNFPT